MRGLFLKIHKWIGICVGIVLFTWVVSGIVMILPGRPIVASRFNSPGDLTVASISPAAAADLVPGDSGAARKVRLVGINGRPFYEVSIQGGERSLLDASSGAVLTITAQVAESLARMAVGAGEAKVGSVDEIGEPSWGYSGGPLPVFRVAFEDHQRTVAYVSMRDGSVQADSRLLRVRSRIQQLHAFEPIEILTERPVLRQAALHVASAVGLCLVLTGYYLALPKGWRRRRELRSTSEG